MGEAKRRAAFRQAQNDAAVAAYVALKQRQRAAARKAAATRAKNAAAKVARSEAAKRAAQTRRLNRETALDNAGWHPGLAA